MYILYVKVSTIPAGADFLPKLSVFKTCMLTDRATKTIFFLQCVQTISIFAYPWTLNIKRLHNGQRASIISSIYPAFLKKADRLFLYMSLIPLRSPVTTSCKFHQYEANNSVWFSLSITR